MYFINKAVIFYRKIGILGWLRFRLLQIAYLIFPCIGCRGKEWSFCLKYLPKIKNKDIKVLDFGASQSLFIYELDRRGYSVTGLDQCDYQEKLPKRIEFIKSDIAEFDIHERFHYVTAISVIEHVGVGEYGDRYYKNGDRIALEKLHRALVADGQLLVTVPNQHFSEGGYSYSRFRKAIDGLFEIYEMTEAKGQILCCLVKKS